MENTSVAYALWWERTLISPKSVIMLLHPN